MSAESIRYTLDAHISTITICRPEARNAVNSEARRRIREAIEEFNRTPDARVLVITGEGDRAFCAGADVKEVADAQTGGGAERFELPIIGVNIQVDKPVIAAVNGLALGYGFLLAQSSDLCLAADSATFGIPEARIGRGASWAAPLPWLIPPRVAMELMMTATPISAERAHEIGLVNQVVRLGDLPTVVKDIASRIADNAPATVRAAKRAVHASLRQRDELQDEVNKIWAPVYASADAVEGPLAFREKRQPKWTGYT